ncbi:hypothetical protein [Burkholderia cepacia]|uniref:hypothetical protein n=1 Tax=Burkholderia cepacia TaxID=292 RepID=UPI0012D95099|nr:hypothetical protein [Burkholderia cepacia]
MSQENMRCSFSVRAARPSRAGWGQCNEIENSSSFTAIWIAVSHHFGGRFIGAPHQKEVLRKAFNFALCRTRAQPKS